jgi:hypothetical protein
MTQPVRIPADVDHQDRLIANLTRHRRQACRSPRRRGRPVIHAALAGTGPRHNHLRQVIPDDPARADPRGCGP